jgi:hypothetical protein
MNDQPVPESTGGISRRRSWRCSRRGHGNGTTSRRRNGSVSGKSAVELGESLHAQNAAAEIKLRAERKAGELLAGMELDKGGRPSANGKKTTLSLRVVLGTRTDEEAHNQSHRWQREASVPEDVFEKHVAECTAEENICHLKNSITLSLDR